MPTDSSWNFGTRYKFSRLWHWMGFTSITKCILFIENKKIYLFMLFNHWVNYEYLQRTERNKLVSNLLNHRTSKLYFLHESSINHFISNQFAIFSKVTRAGKRASTCEIKSLINTLYPFQSKYWSNISTINLLSRFLWTSSNYGRKIQMLNNLIFGIQLLREGNFKVLDENQINSCEDIFAVQKKLG